MIDPLSRLADALAAADADRASELEHLADLADDQVDYLARLGERTDPATDHLEGRCV